MTTWKGGRYLAVVIFLTLNSVLADDVCSELNVTAISPLSMINTLWPWCLDDSDCTDLFYQETPNITVFSYLAKPIVLQYSSLDEPFDNLFCNKTREEALTNLWMLLLKSMIDDTQICDINHILLIDEDQLTSSCVCKGDKVCKDISDHLTLIYIMVAFFDLIGIALVILLGFDIYVRIDIYRKSLQKKSKDVAITITKSQKKMNAFGSIF